MLIPKSQERDLGHPMRRPLHQPFAHDVKRLLRRPFANALAVAAESAIHRVGPLTIGDSNVDQANRLGWRAS